MDAFPAITALSVLFGAALLAGTVRGFVGFGTGMIFLPLAALEADPFEAIVALIAMDLVGPLPALAGAAKHAHWRDLKRLIAGVALALPVGLWALSCLSPDMFRWLVSAVSLTMLIGLVAGWRFAGRLGSKTIFGTGLMSGFVGGVAGIPGPPVIFVYMASPHPVATIRANVTFFLLFYDWMMLAAFGLLSWLDWRMFLVGLLLIVPNMVGNFIGTKLFNPDHETVYRRVAYGIIGMSALAGLPILGLGT